MTLSVDAALTGRRVLITGTTGFIGKALLEKLMREVPGIAQFVLPMRGDRHHPDTQQRLHAQVLSSSVFDRLKHEEPARFAHTVATKLRVVEAEIAEPRLGLSQAAFEALAREVDVVVNVAASVDFREALDRALAINTQPLRELSRLARAGGVPLVQVSTCYVHGFHRGRIGETLSPPSRASLPRRADGSFEVQALIAQLQERIDDVKRSVLEPAAQSRALVALGVREARRHGWNDSYTFTKWLGEQLAWQAMQGGTLSIVRPAIVESALRDPQPGWIEGMKVGDAIVLAYARGKTRLFPARPAGIADIVPVDLVVGGLVLAAAEALQRPGRQRIYQVGSSTRNPVRVGDYVRLCQAEMRENSAAYPRLIRQPLDRPFRTVPRALFLGYLAVGFTAANAAGRVAHWLGLQGATRWMESLQTTRELAQVFSFYTSPRYVFETKATLALSASFDEHDQRRFPVDARCFDWAHYIARVHQPGLERFAVKDKAERLQEAGAEAAHSPLRDCPSGGLQAP
jgi:nucleoside-diphosphate-sugar epimerase